MSIHLSKIDSLLSRSSVKFLLLAVVGVAVYQPLTLLQTPMNPDSQFIFPILKSISSPWDYFEHLFSLRTLDLQPVRDLSFYLDLSAEKFLGMNISIVQNLIFWVSSCWVLMGILRRCNPLMREGEIILIILCFLSYPLFTQSVSWGIARKHILAFFFTLLATKQWIEAEGRFTKIEAFKINTYYFLGVFSQPIGLLWPLWAVVHQRLHHPASMQSSLKVLVPGFFIFLVGFMGNLIYYSQSKVFLELYPAKTNEFLEIPDQILAFGHYVFQIFYPYLLSFTYTLSHWSTLVGILIAGAFLITLRVARVEIRYIINWSLFGLLPLIVVLSKSTILYDTYLLLPACSILLLTSKLITKIRLTKSKLTVYLGCILFFGVYSRNEAAAWKDDRLIMKASFERRPSCFSAFEYLRMSYEQGSVPENKNAKIYLLKNRCEKFEIHGLPAINMKAYLLYYEKDLTDEERVTHLKKLAPLAVLPTLALAALYLDLNEEEQAAEVIEWMKENWKQANFKSEFSPIALKLKKHCLKMDDQDCLSVLSPFTNHRPRY